MKEKKIGYSDNDYPLLASKAYTWFTSERTSKLRLYEQKLINTCLKKNHGTIACSVGFSEQYPQIFTKETKTVITLGTLEGVNSTMRSDIYHWPIQSQCMDTVLLHHVLEWSLHPQRILREASRVLVPGGKLLIVHFNPFSIGSLFHFAQKCFSKKMARKHHYSFRTISQWIYTLGFTHSMVRFDLQLAPFYYPPHGKSFSSSTTLSTKLPFGSIFTLLSTKETLGFIFQKGKVKDKEYSCAHPVYARTS